MNKVFLIGTSVHYILEKGVENKIKENESVEEHLEYTFKNGYTLSEIIDHIEPDFIDDYKVTSKNKDYPRYPIQIIDFDLYSEIIDKTGMDYEPYSVSNEKDNVFLTDEKIKDIFQDLVCEIDVYKEKYEDLKNNIIDNYVPRKMSDYTGDSYDDRF